MNRLRSNVPSTHADNAGERVNGHTCPSRSLEAIATTTRYHCGQAIFSQTGQVEYWYRVLSGAAKVAVIQFNGKRQIIDLLLPGDFLAVLTTEEHEFALEAITEGTVIACYPRQQIEELADSDPRIAREVRILAFETVSRLQEQLLILGRTTSTEKVGCFLLKMSERLGHRSDKVVLPMSRYDIADYLAISVETVCRAMTTLSDRGVIALSGKRRSIRIVDRGALEEDHDSEFGDRNGQVPKIISRS